MDELSFKREKESEVEYLRGKVTADIIKEQGKRQVGTAIFDIPQTERAMDIVMFGPICNMVLGMIYEKGTAKEYRAQREEFLKLRVNQR